MKTIGIIGAGVMGRSLMQDLLQKGFGVVILDIEKKILDDAREEVYNRIRFHSMVNKSAVSYDPDELLSHACFTMDYQKMQSLEIIVENVTESVEIKAAVYRTLENICMDSCIFAANTSCISITQIAAFTKRPSKVIGIHFMNPVPLIDAVEVIKGYHTANESIELIDDLLSDMGKKSIIVNDYPGFVSNRISHLFMNEAAFVVQDNVASPTDVDDIFKKCYGHKLGPLETADLIGLDTVVKSLDILYESYQDSKYRCCPLLRKMVSAGLFGRKSGQGFYKY
jgi:3-hydroxybutyryl-CoA dehydrogenase